MSKHIEVVACTASDREMQCPFCMNEVVVGAKVCRGCGATIKESSSSLFLLVTLFLVITYAINRIVSAVFSFVGMDDFGKGNGYIALAYFIVLACVSLFSTVFVLRKLNSVRNKDGKIKFEFIRHLND